MYIKIVSMPEAKKQLLRVVVLAIMWVSSLASPGYSESSQRAYQIKAAFLYHFAKFIEWPAEAFPTHQSPFNLCILGSDPFGEALQSLQHKTVRDRQVVLQYMQASDALTSCHLLFISSSEQAKLPRLLATIEAAPVLTVGEMDLFYQSGGAIYLFNETNKIRFSINLDAIQRANLDVSSKLLHLSSSIKKR